MIHRSAREDEPGPFPAEVLVRDLRALGLGEGDTVLCHVALSKLGWLIGGRVALLQAIREVVGGLGTIVVPAFTTYLVDPADWRARAVPAQWWAEVRAAMPVFDPDLHSCQPGLGTFPEVVRAHRCSRRSWHPVYSFAALGHRATALTGNLSLDYALGREGVLGRLVDAGVKVLALGLPWWRRCTLFHLAESVAPFPGRRAQLVNVRVPDGAGPGARWVRTQQLVLHDGDFAEMGAGIRVAARTGTVAAGEATLVDGAEVVSRSAQWLMCHRDWRTIDWTRYGFATVPAPSCPV
ncbi:MAG TPA: AAC(3) family N-acetyltransferase [Rugosimonospora sp.]|nr:AAC(3) family N-acetyltransferase [Rugosimonospora sp.]